MAKHHDIVWHKKRGKFIPSTQEKPKTIVPGKPSVDEEKKLSRKEQFLKHLTLEVRKAVRKTE